MKVMEHKYSFCLGIELDAGYTEKTCPRRGRCAYYNESLFREHPDALGEGELLLNEHGRECQHFLPTREEPVYVLEEDPFACE